MTCIKPVSLCSCVLTLWVVCFAPVYLDSPGKNNLWPEGLIVLDFNFCCCVSTLVSLLMFQYSFFTIPASSDTHPLNAFHPMHFFSMTDF